MKRGRVDVVLNYKPGEDSKRFHASNSLETWVIAAVRSGKTYSLIHDILSASWNNTTPHGSLVCAPTFRMVWELIERPLVALADSIGMLAYHQRFEHKAVLRRGQMIYFRSLDDPDRAVRGLNVWRAWIDEVTLCSRYAVDVVRGRLLLTNGKLKAVGTPKGINSWVYDEFYSADAPPRKNIDHIRFSIRNNPVITDDAIARFESMYDPLMVRQEIYAEWVNSNAGRVYYAFDDEKNLAEYYPGEYEPVYIGLDYNLGINAWVAVQRDKKGNLFVIREGYGARTTREVAQQILALYGPQVTVIDDVSGSQRQQGDGQTQRQILQQCGLSNISSNRSNPLRVQRFANTNAHFFNGRAQRHLFCHPECRRLRNELLTLAFKPNSDNVDDRQGKAGHITDALGYVVYYLSGGQAAWL